ncbi:MAG: mechanosensitive ion channel, partial [Phycisphaerales bacterium]|nr:mechanosensitive ion channel [Phycisphaerales bacterium]
ELAQALRIAELEARLAGEHLALRGLEAERQQLLKETFDARIAVLHERETWISRSVVFSANDLRAKMVEMESKGDEFAEQLDLLQRRTASLESEWLGARRRLEESTGDNEEIAAEVASRRLAFQVNQREVSLLKRRIQRLADIKEIWKRRFEVWRSEPERAVLSDWDAGARALLDSLDTEFGLQELELRDLRLDLVSLQDRLDAAAPENPQTARWLREQIRQTNRLDQIYEANAAGIGSARQVTERLLGDINTRVQTVGIGERLAAVWRAVHAVWRFEITSVDDRSITVGKVVIGLLLLLLGFLASRLISAWIGKRLLPRLGVNEGAAAAIRSVLFYLLLITFIFIALRTVNVPLTAFTILGGALAIGVGFGSQNIMNNFMSGLIIIAERPIRVGNLIQIEGLYGVVKHIGARSTRVLTGDNIEIVVPNSSFLESNVINWTLSESKVRTHVGVGVAYGSPLREVVKYLRKATDEHGRVLKSPAPIVLFKEFGDNSLSFEVHFWIVMRTMMDRRIVESDIRHRIDGLFHDAGIVIAFPQRDVHINSLSPIDVRLITPADTQDPAARAE